MEPLSPRRFSIADIRSALSAGRETFRGMPGLSIAFSAVFAVIGLGLLAAIGRFGVSPMALPFAGGFMLVGPVLLTGFFRLRDLQGAGQRPGFADALVSMFRAQPGLWMVALFCAFLFLIWITDVGVLYSFMIGGEHLPYELPWMIRPQGRVLAFELWATLMGSVLAFIIFAVSAFSVPLLHEGRAGPVQAVHASVRAVFRSLPASLAWGTLLSLVVVISILLLPLLVITLPVLAYASHALYRQVFPAS